MRRFLLTTVILCILIAPLPASAAPARGNAEKAETAGMLLADIIELIADEYAGGAVTIDELYEAALRGMSNILDPYSEYLDPDDLSSFTGSLTGRLIGIGVVMRNNDGGQPEIIRIMPDSPALEAGLKKGDVIVSVNGASVVGRTATDVVDIVLNPDITSVTMQVRRGGERMDFTMTKRAIKSVTVFLDRLEDILGASAAQTAADYRYISVTSISETTGNDLRTALTACRREGVKGIILDFRGNSGGYLNVAVNICNQLVPAGPIYHTTNSRGQRQTYNSYLREKPFEKIAVLVDSDTASAAELITAALQDSKAAVVIGQTTFGKGVIQTMFSLPAGGAFKLTTEEYFRRSGGAINNIGVTPDITVEMNYYDYETPNDKALKRALEWMTGN